ncbi:MAG: M48 family metalloprotease [Desulfobacteraceae bacterium]|nr:M48 family metalloprotease [Desulfobacteraceae bacterium]
MKTRIFTAFFVSMFIIASLGISSSGKSLSEHLSEQKLHIEWLLGIYGELSQEDHPLVLRAGNVFERVVAVADKCASRPPKLLIIRGAGNPWTMCLEDGTVILGQKGMEICYQGVDKATGDSRLAFVLGHELAHLARDDFWQWTAFETLERLESDQKTVLELLNLIRKTEDVDDTDLAKEIRRKKELQADGYGLLYASMAGYDPKAIADKQGKNFFREWVNQVTGKLAYADELHPDSEQRAVFLLSTMKTVSDELEIFYIGVRLYQLGKYKEALDFLEAFQKRFPCREISNNIGLVHYQMAMKVLYKYDPEKTCKYKLATVLDTETRARRFIKRGTESENVFKYLSKSFAP